MSIRQLKRGGGALVGILLASCGGAASSGGSASPTAGPHLVTPADAMVALRHWVDVSARASVQLDPVLNSSVEMPPLATLDEAGFLATKNLGKKPDPAATASDLKVYVPHQASYPGFFMATVKYTTPNRVLKYLVCFEKKDARSPWLAHWQPGLFANTDFPAVSIAPDGYADLISATQAKGLVMDQSLVAGALASYLNDAVSRAQPGESKDFTSNGGTKALVDALVASVTTGAAKSTSVVFQFTPRPDTNVAFATPDGGALIFFAVNETQRFSATNGGLFTQDPGHTSLGPLLPPGQYASVAVNFIQMLAATIPPKSANKKTAIVALTGGEVSASG